MRPSAMDQGRAFQRLPKWFKVPLSTNGRFASVRSLVQERGLHTVCQSAACPNRNECWNNGTATFLILGDRCTRGCRFCNVPQGRPEQPDPREPERVATAVAALRLSYAVVTSVTRDDLPDGGAELFAETVRAIRSYSPGCKVELLVPDFQGDRRSLATVLRAQPDVLNHNLETVPSLYGIVRPRAAYARSLEVLRQAGSSGTMTKTGIMLGLGESREDIGVVLRDVHRSGCAILTIGQYLQPHRAALPVVRYYRPEEFEEIANEARRTGIRRVLSGPLVRSSYHAERHGSESVQEEGGGEHGSARQRLSSRL